MDRRQGAAGVRRSGVPRTRGDGPAPGWPTVSSARSVPRTRGDGPEDLLVQKVWQNVFPAHAGMDRPSGRNQHHLPLCSPHTRGWTERTERHSDGIQVFPAHAGMDRTPPGRPWGPSRVFPAHAGMDRPATPMVSLPSGVPRTRGDGPAGVVSGNAEVSACSPHTRGWTDLLVHCQRGEVSVPRTRGDGPHTAGETLGTIKSVPRTRGDGPTCHANGVTSKWCSPHTRGWTGRGSERECRGECVFPAHAGMDHW